MKNQKIPKIYNMFTSSVQIGDISIFYKVYGSTLPHQINEDQLTLIFLHGGPGFDHAMHEKFWSRLAPEIQVILPDHRGNGRSIDPNSKNWNLEQWGQDVHSFIHALKLKRKPFVGGISFGGYVLLHFASQFPEDASALILCNSEACPKRATILNAYRANTRNLDKNLAEKVLKTAEQLFDNPTAEAISNYISTCLPYAGYPPESEEDSNNCIMNLLVAEHFFRHIFLKFNLIPLLDKITAPVLMLTSGLSPIHNQQHAIETLTYLKNAIVEYHYYPNAGAPVYEFNRSYFLSIIKDFIFRHDR